MKMTAEQLMTFVRSSIEFHQDDAKLAAYLKRVTLTDRLDAGEIGEMKALGAGTKTLEALAELREASAQLPSAAPAPAAPSDTLPAAPDASEQNKVLAAATTYALGYSQQLPDFICRQVTRRYRDPNGMGFHLLDVIAEKLSYFGHKEQYTVVTVNGQPRSVTHENLGGSISGGEFGSMMSGIFKPESKAHFEWERWATLRGLRMHVFSYRVQQPNSEYKIAVPREHLEIVTAYHGLVYVDAGSHSIHRVTLVADGIPASFPVQEVSEELDYGDQTIDGRRFLLPYGVEVRSRLRRTTTKNLLEFRQYNKFGADATILFDGAEQPPGNKP